jgi:hypothetical protein
MTSGYYKHKEQKKNVPVICLWCHCRFMALDNRTFFCSNAHYQEFERMRNAIVKEYSFEYEKRDSGLEKLKRLGKDYK